MAETLELAAHFATITSRNRALIQIFAWEAGIISTEQTAELLGIDQLTLRLIRDEVIDSARDYRDTWWPQRAHFRFGIESETPS